MEQVIACDSGSTVLGFSIAFLSLDFCRARPEAPSPCAFPLIIAAFPLLDAALAILRRILNRTSPFHGDRLHFYDLLLARGWSPRATVLACYAINGSFVVLGLLSLHSRIAPMGWLSALASAAFCTLAIRLGSLHSTEPPAAPHRVKA